MIDMCWSKKIIVDVVRCSNCGESCKCKCGVERNHLLDVLIALCIVMIQHQNKTLQMDTCLKRMTIIMIKPEPL